MESKKYHEINKYKDNLFPVEIYRVSNSCIFPSGRGLKDFHWHEELQFTYAIKGSLIFQAGAANYSLKEGESAFINSGVIHAITHLSEGGMYTSLNFPCKLLSFFPGSRMEKDYVLPYTSGGSVPVILFKPESTWQQSVLNILQEINSVWESSNVHHNEYYISLKIVSIWHILSSHFPEKTNQISSSDLLHRERIQSMISFIYEHFHEDISLTDIAGCAHVSTGECCRIFREQLQTTPYQFLTKYRIQKSLEMLSSNLSISETARLCGYNQTSNYISKFKNIMNCTPTQYRKCYIRK